MIRCSTKVMKNEHVKGGVDTRIYVCTKDVKLIHYYFPSQEFSD